MPVFGYKSMNGRDESFAAVSKILSVYRNFNCCTIGMKLVIVKVGEVAQEVKMSFFE